MKVLINKRLFHIFFIQGLIILTLFFCDLVLIYMFQDFLINNFSKIKLDSVQLKTIYLFLSSVFLLKSTHSKPSKNLRQNKKDHNRSLRCLKIIQYIFTFSTIDNSVPRLLQPNYFFLLVLWLKCEAFICSIIN